MTRNLDNRTAIVTGGASGIGAETCHVLARKHTVDGGYTSR